MADLAYTIAGNVLDKLGSLAYQEVSLAWGMKQDLDKLKLITLALQDVLLDAETKQENNPQLKNWLNHLKDVFHDAVDVLDEFECELLRRQVVKKYASFGRKVCRFFSWSNPLVYRFSVVHQVKEIRQQFDEIAKNMEKFHLIKTQLNMDQNPPMHDNREMMTHSFVNPLDVIGGCDQLNLASEFINKDVQLSLHGFLIYGLPETTELPQWLQQAAKTLQKLHIGSCPKLSRLPEWLPKLTSLEKLVIRNCPELLSLPDGMEGLTSLTHLEIEDCDALQEACKPEVGSDWHKIAHVPNRIIGPQLFSLK
ncbi:hypothetical protein G4B88_028500 [Cannabis sativa]|uniref:Disease resistance N-terminal domain-containing protein n=1 Tax=Cannabis sativa TaxID=3483 RepID=A0A7J6GNB9_CANSA|nr:hypothetical protein G4B88_028500 [Cannabis sativa]